MSSICFEVEIIIACFQKIPHPPKGGYWKFQSEGSLKIFKGTYKQQPGLKYLPAIFIVYFGFRYCLKRTINYFQFFLGNNEDKSKLQKLFYSSLFCCVVLTFTKQNSSNSDSLNLSAGKYHRVFNLSSLRLFICHVVCMKSVLNP